MRLISGRGFDDDRRRRLAGCRWRLHLAARSLDDRGGGGGGGDGGGWIAERRRADVDHLLGAVHEPRDALRLAPDRPRRPGDAPEAARLRQDVGGQPVAGDLELLDGAPGAPAAHADRDAVVQRPDDALDRQVDAQLPLADHQRRRRPRTGRNLQRSYIYIYIYVYFTAKVSGGFRGCGPLASFRKIQGLPISKIVRTADSTVIIITDFFTLQLAPSNFS